MTHLFEAGHATAGEASRFGLARENVLEAVLDQNKDERGLSDGVARRETRRWLEQRNEEAKELRSIEQILVMKRRS